MSDSISIIVPGVPVAKGRPRASQRNGRVFMYTPKKTQDYEDAVRKAGLRAMDGAAPLSGPMTLRIETRLEVPKSWPKWKRAKAYQGEVMPTKRPDVDNYIKGILDGLNGVLFVDDSLITDLIVTKRYAEKPMAIVVAAELAGKAAA